MTRALAFATSPAAVLVDRCRHCGCTPAAPCRLFSNDECGWQNAAHDLCTNPSCYRAEERAKREIERKRRRDLAADVLPIVQRFDLARRRQMEKRNKQAKKRQMKKQHGRAA